MLRIPTTGLLAVGYLTFTLLKDLHTEFPVFAMEAYADGTRAGRTSSMEVGDGEVAWEYLE